MLQPRESSLETWWQVANECEHATFFHTPLWNQLVCESHDVYTGGSISMELETGTTAVLPIQTKQPTNGDGFVRAFSPVRESTFAGCYGGMIADGPTGGEAPRLYEDALSTLASLQVVENPLEGGENGVGDLEIPGAETETDFTQLIELGDDYDDVVAGFSKGRRQNIDRARDAGVTVRRGTSIDDYERYYEAYQASLERWGDVSMRYDWDLFETAHQLSEAHPSNVRLWLAELDGEVASGALVFYWNGHAVYWHGASFEEYFEHYPNDILHAEIIRHAVDEGYDYYDFNPSGGHEGVVEFKSGFGPERRQIRRWQYRPPLTRSLTTIGELFDDFDLT